MPKEFEIASVTCEGSLLYHILESCLRFALYIVSCLNTQIPST